ncbi:MAG: hypothetical protein VB075_18045 [Petrimonas sp.]|uniref:hypothetical protein n=1 Tax=Petrimonas sp. TaxID=2023866 RepID=UPI002B396086|nr:hypothetical protein [Petrimonas sp.]MEA4995180.1 hypothetical protein [Petrimonas sp.]MEA5046458.1 hypothetical protein [Petrimonas sp.]
MPYRRLPNTDLSRIKALKTAIEKAAGTDFQDVALSMKTLSRARSAVEKLERLSLKYQQTLDTQVKANIAFQSKVKNARMYLSHFIQVLYMCVMRSEIKPEHLELYGLQDANFVVPDLSSNEQLLQWGQKIINGENKRVARGGVPIYNPGIAKVSVMYILFKEGYQTQQIHQKATARTLDEVSGFRNEVDSVILDIWEEVEKFNAELQADERLDKNREYGLIYYYRKGETMDENR